MQIRYRMAVDMALAPFAALAVVALVARLHSASARKRSVVAPKKAVEL